jgi:hypothetical protein
MSCSLIKIYEPTTSHPSYSHDSLKTSVKLHRGRDFAVFAPSLNTVRVMKLRRIKWLRHISRGGKKNVLENVNGRYIYLFTNGLAALGQVSSEYFGFPCQSFHKFLHHHNHMGLAQ